MYSVVKTSLHLSKSSSATLLNPSTRDVYRQQATSVGMYVPLTNTTNVKLIPGEWKLIRGWNVDSEKGGSYLNQVLFHHDEFVIQKSGMYMVTVNLQIEDPNKKEACDDCDIRFEYGLIGPKMEDYQLQDVGCGCEASNCA